jgi:cytochrome P450
VTEQTETPAWPDNIEFADIDELMREFHVFDPKMAECPHALLERIRTECPVGRSEKFDGYWVVTGVEPMRQVLGDPQTFSSTVPIIPRLSGADLSFAIPSGIDPPQHTQYRRLLGSVFSRKRIAALDRSYGSWRGSCVTTSLPPRALTTSRTGSPPLCPARRCWPCWACPTRTST